MKNYVQCKFKYSRLIGELRQWIMGGAYSEGEKLPPERKLAEQFGFSRVTIRTALKQLSEDGLLEIRPNVGVFVKRHNQDVAEIGSRKFHFCVVLNQPSDGNDPLLDPFNSQVVLGILQARTAEDDFDVEYFQRNMAYRTLEEDMAANGYDIKRFDGIVFTNSVFCAVTDITWIDRIGVKMVVLGEMGCPRFVPTVTIDNFNAIYMMVEWLARHGRKCPILLCNNVDLVWERRRRQGFIAALQDLGFGFEEWQIIQVDMANDLKGSEQALAGILKRGNPFDSMVVLGDCQLIGAVEALKKANLRVPEDILCISLDFFSWLNGLVDKMPRVIQPLIKAGGELARLLVRHIRDPDETVYTVVLQPNLMEP